MNEVKIHNVYTTPDGKFVVGGSQEPEKHFAFTIDTQIDEMAWSIEFPDPQGPDLAEGAPFGSPMAGLQRT